jgi:RNase P subunit RPR2
MYDNRCYYCDKGGGLLQREHRIPLARGGDNDISNIVPACENCNRRKGIKTDDEFFKLLADKWEYSGTDDDSTQPVRPFPGEMSLEGRAVRIPLQRRKRVNLELPPGMKLCTTCHKVLAITEFGSHRGKKDGLASRCKKCSAEASKSWRKSNPDKWAATRKQSRQSLEPEMDSERQDEADDSVEDE